MGGDAAGTGSGLEVRLHAPRIDVVVVWVSGLIDPTTVGLLVLRIGQQLPRTPRVIVDLSGVHGVVGDAVRALGRVVEAADAHGVELHVAGVEHYALDCALRRAGFGRLHSGPAAAVLAPMLATADVAGRVPFASTDAVARRVARIGAGADVPARWIRSTLEPSR